MPQKQPSYLSISTKGHNVFGSYGETIDSFEAVQASNGLYPYKDVVKDVDVRRGFDRRDYNLFRRNEQIPTKFKDIVKMIRTFYYRSGVIRNVVDMMVDFACEDLRFLHPDKKIQAFYETWKRKINLASAVEEFAKRILLECNVAAKRVTAQLTVPVQNQVFAAADIKLKVEKPIVDSKEIPWGYIFLDVANLDWQGNDFSGFSKSKKLVYPIPQKLISLYQSVNKDQFAKDVIDSLPADVKDALANQKRLVQLDNDKIYISQVKKDSWEPWAVPFLYSVLPDILFKEKLRQADISALDGVINVIRLWKLGDHKEGILPNQAVVDKLINILNSNTGGGAMDIVWDSLIDMQDFYPPVDKILGSEKYDQVNQDILIGLGVPEVLIGGKGANFSNSFIQLKTLIERLQSVRSKIIEWLEFETKLIKDAMGFDSVPKIVFSQMNLRDENIEKQLITGLLDRGIISPEAVLEVYGKDFEIELERIKEQRKEFKDSGLEIKSPFDKTPLASNKNGRPPATQDVSRKQRKAKPRTASIIDGSEIIAMFDDVVVPLYMETAGLTNARQLTNTQKEEINSLRVACLTCINSIEDLTEEKLIQIASGKQKYDSSFINYITDAISEYTINKGKEPTLAQRKQIEAASWALYLGEKNG